MILDFLAYLVMAGVALLAIASFVVMERELKIRFVISAATTGALLWAVLRVF